LHLSETGGARCDLGYAIESNTQLCVWDLGIQIQGMTAIYTTGIFFFCWRTTYDGVHHNQ